MVSKVSIHERLASLLWGHSQGEHHVVKASGMSQHKKYNVKPNTKRTILQQCVALCAETAKEHNLKCNCLL